MSAGSFPEPPAPVAPVPLGGVRVWAQDYAAGALPPVCAVTGQPTDQRYRRQFATAPGWVFLLILVGLIWFIIAYAITAKRVQGLLPMTPEARSRSRRPIWIGLGLIILAPVLWVAASATANPNHSVDTGFDLAGLMILLGLLALVGGFILILLRDAFGVRGKVHDVQFGAGVYVRAIDMTGVHPNFVEAVTSMYSQRAAANTAG